MNDYDKAKKVLNEIGVIVKITDVLAVTLDDHPGGAAKIIDVLSQNDISVEYMYAFDTKITGKAIMVAKTDDVKAASDLLVAKGFADISSKDVFRA